MLRTLLAMTCVSLLPLAVPAADPVPAPKTVMSECGKLLFADAFTQPLSKDWSSAKGKWEIVDGALRGAELKADKHGAVTRHALPLHNAIIQFSFKLDGTRQTTLSINDAKGHCCRLVITPTGLRVQKDSHDHNVKDKAVGLDQKSAAFKPGEWHTIVLEVQGKEIVACLDGGSIAFGAHDSIDVPKANLGLTVAGESASFKDLRVWEAMPNKSWPATRAKLLGERKAAGGSK